MTIAGWLQIGLFIGALTLLVKPLGSYMARVFQGERTFLHPVIGPLERALYRAAGVKQDDEMKWQTYALAMLAFNMAGLLAVYVLQRIQGALPLNPLGLGAVPPDLAFNTAVSFASNTNWQSYAGENTLSYLTQMLGLTVQNFASAATGIAVLLALIRGLSRHSASTVGNYWVDLTRAVFYVLLPISLILALLLVSQGVVQTLRGPAQASFVEAVEGASFQSLPLGPAASQIAIKQLGTNGGGFFGANSAHPFENPTPLSNFLEMLSILLIPAALCYTYGKMTGDTRQGWGLFLVMLLLFSLLAGATVWAEQSGNPALSAIGVDQTAGALQPGGSMEGKEVRFGISNSALWAAATSSASNGSVNAMHDSFTALGGMIPMWLIQLGEVIFGGVGSGLYGMLAFVIIAVFVAGLMIGRTPEYLGKKIEAFEVKMASMMVLLPVLAVLAGTATAVLVSSGNAAASNPGPHGFSEILYAFSSAANNNGSAFAGLGTNTLFYNIALGICMFLGRYWLAVPALAIAGSLAAKKKVPPSSGTLPTQSPLFLGWLVAVILIVGALSFLPALSLGPIAEYFLSR
jgi:potassium-transporting ATPase potassium-binding subunit